MLSTLRYLYNHIQNTWKDGNTENVLRQYFNTLSATRMGYVLFFKFFFVSNEEVL